MDIGTDMVHAPLQRSQRDLATRSQSGRSGTGGDLEEIENEWDREVHRVTPIGTRQLMLG